LPGCPKGDKNDWKYSRVKGVCEYQIYNDVINWKYVVIIAASIPCLLLCLCLFYHFRKMALRKLYPIEEYLAVVLAKIHNAAKAKGNSDMVEIGLGSDKAVIKEWVKDIWDLYVIDACEDTRHLGGMSREQFQYFVRSSFIITRTQFNLLFETKDINELSRNRFKLHHGRISKKSLFEFLLRLRYAKEPKSFVQEEDVIPE